MTGPADALPADSAAPDSATQDSAAPDSAATLERVRQAQQLAQQELEWLHDGFEKLAGHLKPLLTRQYQETQTRVRVLETRLRTRQERPLIMAIARLLDDVRRIESGADVKVHVEEALLEALTGAGYQEMGSPGDQFDPQWHEPLAGSLAGSLNGTASVTRVHRRGLACHGDVIVKALVEVGTAVAESGAQSEATEHGGIPA